EARSHAEEMARGLLVESADRVRRGDRTERAEDVLGRRLAFGEREDLQPVAGRDQHRLAHARKRLELLQPGRDLLGGDRELLAHRDGRLLVRHADAKKGHGAAATVAWSAGAVTMPT